MSEREVRITGGCQCGAVRYALHETPSHPHICHCRMCQKAFGSFFAPLTGVPRKQFELTRGSLSTFKSSDQVERGFCKNCGTPLTFAYVEFPADRGLDRLARRPRPGDACRAVRHRGPHALVRRTRQVARREDH